MKSASTLGRFGAEGGVELIDLRTPGNDPVSVTHSALKQTVARAVTGRCDFYQHDTNDPLPKAEPANEFDERIAW